MEFRDTVTRTEGGVFLGVRWVNLSRFVLASIAVSHGFTWSVSLCSLSVRVGVDGLPPQDRQHFPQAVPLVCRLILPEPGKVPLVGGLVHIPGTGRG